jgi:cytosine/adenosine deaminase-related metal-dependent hydrolase
MEMITVGRLAATPGVAAIRGPSTIHIDGGRISAVEDAASDAATAGLIALPAPANAHDHGRGMRPVAVGALDDVLETWISALGREPYVDPYTRAAVAFARMAEGGICAANHCHYTQMPSRMVEEGEAVSRAAADVGIRIAFSVPINDRNPIVYGDFNALGQMLPPDDLSALRARTGPFQTAADALAIVDRIAAFEHPGFSVQYCPIGPQWVEDATLQAIAEASARTGRRVHMHLFETRPQREWADYTYPDGLVGHLDRIGLLSPRLTVAHGVWLNRDECALLAERGVTVSANSSSNLRLRSGLADARFWTGSGLRFGIGLDGMAFDDDEDMLREIRLLWCLQRGFAGETVLTPDRLFQAACVDGRRTIVADDGGRIVVGAPADLVVLDLADMWPDLVDDAIDPLDLLLTRMTKRHLRQLVVAGRRIVENGRCVTVDRPALEAKLWSEARTGWAKLPPDTRRLNRLQGAIRRFYACGCHVGGTMTAS